VDSLNNISITCFAVSYLIVFALEIARVFFQSEVLQTKHGRLLKIGISLAGLFAHTVYLACHGGLEFDSKGLWLGNWSGWCLTASWLLAVAYVWISIRRVESVFGLFLLPTVLVLIWISSQFGDSQSFSTTHARTVWNMIHGASLLLGTTVVALGCTFGILYLLQASRLKRKTPPSRWLRLPSLEWLQQSCERTLVISAGLLAIGLISGIAINQVNAAGTDRAGTIAWSDPVIWSSGILFGWLLAATVFNLFYRPARRGRKVAYLVVASFLFLVLELGIVWWAGHATTKANARVHLPVSSLEVALAGQLSRGNRSTLLPSGGCPPEGVIA
jgi:ABC-type uncharacterized transport system permease subunit